MEVSHSTHVVKLIADHPVMIAYTDGVDEIVVEHCLQHVMPSSVRNIRVMSGKEETHITLREYQQ